MDYEGRTSSGENDTIAYKSSKLETRLYQDMTLSRWSLPDSFVRKRLHQVSCRAENIALTRKLDGKVVRYTPVAV